MKRKISTQILEEQKKQTELLKIITKNIVNEATFTESTKMIDSVKDIEQEMLKEVGVTPDRIYLIAEACNSSGLPIFVIRRPLKF